MYRAVVPITINVPSDNFKEAVRLAKQMVELLMVLPSVTHCGDIVVYDQDGRKLYPEPEEETHELD